MPPVSGLYSAALPPLAAAFFASSPYLQTGPVAITSLLTFGALAGRAPVGSPEYVQLGVALALIVGLTRIVLGLLRGGVVAYLISEPMMMGFLPAAAILIAASQLPAVLGATSDGGVLDAAARALIAPSEWDPAAIVFAVLAAGLVVAGRRVHRFFPSVLVALLLALAAAGLVGYGGTVVGAIPEGLPPAPHLMLASLPDLAVPGIVIALVGFAEPASVARTYATRERRSWDPDRELTSQGIANMASALSSGYPVGGSLSRSALNHRAGAATRLSGAVTGLTVLLFLPVAGILAQLPTAVLAAVVICAVAGLIRLGPLVGLWRVSRPQFVVGAATFALTLLLSPHVERAVVAGVALAVAVHLARELTIRFDVAANGNTLTIRPAGVLWFATAHDLHERLIALLERHPEVDHMRIDLDGLGRIDLTGAMTISRVLDDVRTSGVTVELAGVPPQSQELLRRYAARLGDLG